MVLKVYTAQYRYAGPDRLDITVKTGNKAFAPTWDIVMGLKQGQITEAEYEARYRELMRASWRRNRAEWQRLLARDRVVLVCFCPPGAFCHRVLLAGYLEKCGATYCGELDPRSY